MEKHTIINIAGHVDHGKTALVHCLTGIDTKKQVNAKLFSIVCRVLREKRGH
ncbi:MAG: hypothetical protein KAU60_00310 [Desulfobacterales bacterium]|nr:hypothetical protein [Desulfobacterales bacterium]